MKRRVGAAVVAGLSTLLLGALSQIPYGVERGGDSALRFAWRSPGVRLESCRPLTDDEIARTPPHMRPTEICEGENLPFRFEVAVDGLPMIDRLIVSSGARADRPLYVFDEIRVAPGVHDVRVTFAPESEEAGIAPGGRLELHTQVELGAGDIALITRTGGGSLEVRSPPPADRGSP